MPFDLESAMPIAEKGETIRTTSFDLGSAKPINPEPSKEKIYPIASFLRKIFRNTPLEQVETTLSYLENIEEMPKQEKGEGFFSWMKRTSESLEPREKEIEEEGVLRQIEKPLTGAMSVTPMGAPVQLAKTAGAIGAYSIADHFFNAKRFIRKNFPDTPPLIEELAEIGDFIAKGAIIAGGFRAGKKFVIDRMNKLNLPKSVQIPSEKIDILKNNETIKKELGIKNNQISASENSGKPLEVPVEKVLNLSEKKKWWEIFKKDLKIKESDIPIKAEDQNVLLQLERKAAENRVIKALKEAEPVRKIQEELYTKERGQRMAKALSVGKKTTGEKGFGAELGQLKGELPKAQFESIREKLKPGDIDILFDTVKNSENLTFWETISARTGLGKMFGQFGGQVPTKSELSLLNKVFGDDLIKVLLEKRPFWLKFRDEAASVINFPKTIIASFDLSAPFRQGLFFVGKPEFRKSFGPMFKSFASEEYYKGLQEQIRKRPTYDKMVQSKLSLTEIGGILDTREEAFMSQLAEKIPGVKASGRAYTAFLNKLRADVFDSMYSAAEKAGRNPAKNADLVKQISGFINAATGRGGLGGLEKMSLELNEIFFSPRLISSRLTLLNPMYYATRDPFVRKEALKSLFGMTAFVSSALGIAKLSGAEIGTDPRSSDFLKAKIGNTRIDFLGGFQQYMRMAGQIISGKYVSSTTGKEYTLGEGYKPLTRTQIIGRGVRSKLSPFASFLLTQLDGVDWKGQKIDMTEEVKNRLIPMLAQDLYDLYQEDPDLIPLAVLPIFGMGVQTYGSPKKQRTSRSKKNVDMFQDADNSQNK